MFLALDVLLDLDVEDAVSRRHLRLLVQLETGATQQLVAVETLRRRLAVFATHQLADVTEGVLGRLLATHHLRQT